MHLSTTNPRHNALPYVTCTADLPALLMGDTLHSRWQICLGEGGHSKAERAGGRMVRLALLLVLATTTAQGKLGTGYQLIALFPQNGSLFPSLSIQMLSLTQEWNQI